MSPPYALHETHLHAAGCQQWSPHTIAGTSSYFAFCSTLSIYVFSTTTLELVKLIPGHEKCITVIKWSPTCSHTFATGSVSGHVSTWDLRDATSPSAPSSPTHTIDFGSPVLTIEWSPTSPNPTHLVVSTRAATVYLWDTTTSPSTNSSPLTKSELYKMSLWTNSNESNPAKALVVKWHPTDSRLIAAGNSDGSIRLFDMSTETLTKIPPMEKGVAVAAMSWDPLSDQYMLVSNAAGTTKLMDVSSKTMVRSFDKETHTVKAMAWLDWAPGNFATCNARTGVIKVWNVSQAAPIQHIRVGHVGLQSFFLIPNSARAVCSFTDGSVCLYHMKKKQKEFTSKPGHTETVFGCAISPTNATMMATSSFDATIKIWHTVTMELSKTLTGQDGVIYSMAWSDDGQRLASTSIKGTVFIWDVEMGEPLHKLTHHNDSVYSVAWNPLGPRLLLSTSGDGTACVFDEQGTVSRWYRFPAGCFGCSWHPTNPNVFVVGCADHNSYVYDISLENGDALLYQLRGHSARVFHTVWSPRLANTLATGSDDKTIRVWDRLEIDEEAPAAMPPGRHPAATQIDNDVDIQDAVSKKKQVTACRVMNGHVSYVRPVVWHTEIPHLILSGSWDGTIRLWDARKEGKDANIFTAKGHVADVYGLTFHPQRPFTIMSTSRDTTVRFWNLTGLSSIMLYNGLREKSLSKFRGDASEASLGMLCGVESARLEASFKKLSMAGVCEKLFEFFGGDSGVDEFWSAARLCLHNGDGSDEDEEDAEDAAAGQSWGGAVATATFSKSIMHTSEALKSSRAEASNLESIRMRRGSMGGGIGGMKKDEQIRKAAEAYTLCGDLRKYCDIMVELGEWERAIAVAPGVDFKYWQSLSAQYGRKLSEELSEDCVPFLAASGYADEGVDFFAKRNQFKQAFSLASATSGGSFIGPAKRRKEGESKGGEESEGEDERGQREMKKQGSKFILRTTAQQMSDHYSNIGKDVMAATSFLATNDAQSAMNYLLDGDQFLLAYGLAKCAGLMEESERLGELEKMFVKRMEEDEEERREERRERGEEKD